MISTARIIGFLAITMAVGAWPAVGGDGAEDGTKEVRRNLLVVYGIENRESPGDYGWPRDTKAERILQTPLEWMGYELRYVNVLKKRLPRRSELSEIGGLIIDGTLRVPVAREEKIAEFIEAAKEEGVPVLLFGAYPFSDLNVIRHVQSVLGIRGDGSEMRFPETTGILSIDEEMMNFEADVRPRNTSTMRLQAPEKADVYLSTIARDSDGNAAAFDPVFIADWGGAVLDPYLEIQPSEKQTLLLFDVYRFLERLWPSGRFPAPDPSTRDGLRAFYSHVDGDGFATLSHLRGGATCAEILYERILTKYPFPVTVSVVEATVRGLERNQLGSREDFERTAKEIFRLPQIEAATHTYSHPFIWMDGDLPYEEKYEVRNLVFKDEIAYPAIDLKREIVGSAEYVKSLLPEGGEVKMVLWSGNCMPGPDAVRIAGEAGLENMNGGDTVISRRNRGMVGIAPRVLSWDDQLQVLASNQNDFVYTQDWTGKSLTGFADVIQTFELTESPRRLKPVNIYYHFYSASMLGPLSALDRVNHWCLNQPLHPLTASLYARIARDSHYTRIFSAGDRRWRIENGGDLRTLRMPRSAGVPDMPACEGVTGYTAERDWHYIHTDGSTSVTLRLVDPETASPHLFLDRSDTELVFESLSAASARFRTIGADLRDANLTFAGAKPGSEFNLTVDGSVSLLRADSQGRVAFTCPNQATVSLVSAL